MRTALWSLVALAGSVVAAPAKAYYNGTDTSCTEEQKPTLPTAPVYPATYGSSSKATPSSKSAPWTYSFSNGSSIYAPTATGGYGAPGYGAPGYDSPSSTVTVITSVYETVCPGVSTHITSGTTSLSSYTTTSTITEYVTVTLSPSPHSHGSPNGPGAYPSQSEASPNGPGAFPSKSEASPSSPGAYSPQSEAAASSYSTVVQTYTTVYTTVYPESTTGVSGGKTITRTYDATTTVTSTWYETITLTVPTSYASESAPGYATETAPGYVHESAPFHSSKSASVTASPTGYTPAESGSSSHTPSVYVTTIIQTQTIIVEKTTTATVGGSTITSLYSGTSLHTIVHTSTCTEGASTIWTTVQYGSTWFSYTLPATSDSSSSTTTTSVASPIETTSSSVSSGKTSPSGSKPILSGSRSSSKPYNSGSASVPTISGSKPVISPSGSSPVSSPSKPVGSPSGSKAISTPVSSPSKAISTPVSSPSKAVSTPVSSPSKAISTPVSSPSKPVSSPSSTKLIPSSVVSSFSSTKSFPSSIISSKTSTKTSSTSTCSTPTPTSCVPCEGQPGSKPDEYCGYTISDNWYEVTPKTCRTVTYDFEITNGTVSPDGVERIGFMINGQFPGPKIEANWGDTIVVHVTNSLTTNGTSLHFHGIRQFWTNEMDGVPSITQCALAPGESMTYTFQATNYGSSWYHSHFAIQTYGGVFGPMTIHGPATEEYDEEQSLLLQDWNHVTTDALYDAAQTQGPRTLDTGLINGLNVWGADDAVGTTGERFSMTVVSGKRYRLRLVNTAIQSTFKFYIDGHKFKVIAMDFVPIRPYETNIVNINIGQRYDLIFTADQTPGNYWMRADNQNICAVIKQATNIKGIVTYEGVQKATPSSTAYTYTAECVDEPLASLVPYVPLNAGATPDDTIPETVTIAKNNDNLFKWSLSSTTFQSQWGDPTLNQIYHNGTIPTYSGRLAIEVPKLKEWVYIIIDSPIPAPHPIHLHGHDFFILAQGKGLYNSANVVLNTVNPPRRDVALMPFSVGPSGVTGGHLVLAFETDNPGAWLMHCHIGWHVSMGFALQIIEGTDLIKESVTDSCQLDKTCSAWNSYAQANDIVVTDSGV